ncbi:hypothetical protein BD408DRAFT_434511 [Parasitella parasitica]|nr:hypothetical protein BD408DRAFT_434511 [Parasitella parasitica]
MSSINGLTDEKIQKLLEFYEQYQGDHNEEAFDRSQLFDLPTQIISELEESTSSELRSKLKQFHKDTLKYEGGKWTRSGAINRIFLSELKKQRLDATQTINAFYKGADRLRTTEKACAEIFADFQHIIEQGVYSFATGKELDQDAKDLATRTIKLPENMQYLRDNEEEGRDLAFPTEVVEKIYQGRYEETILKQATSRSYGGFKSRGDHRSSHRGGRTNFFGKGRGRGQPPPPTTTISHHPSNSTDQ